MTILAVPAAVLREHGKHPAVIWKMHELNFSVTNMKCSLVALVLLPLSAFALEGTGSVDFDSSIIPLLDQSPVLKEFVLCNFDIVADPMGNRLGSAQTKELGGARIGPYSMWANWHAQTGVKPVVLTINTRTDFLDAKGKALDSNFKSAVRIREHIAGVTIEPAEKDQPASVPGGPKHAIDEKACSPKPTP